MSLSYSNALIIAGNKKGHRSDPLKHNKLLEEF